MEDEKDLEVEKETDSGGDGEDSDEALVGHMTDYLFDEKSLDWIEKHYGNSMNFMYSYGLKFYDDNDCAEAQSIARVMREPD